MSLKVTSSVKLKTLADFLQDAIGSWQNEGRETEAQYLVALVHLLEVFSRFVGAVHTTYTFNGQTVELYDIKCKKRGGEEDRVVKQMYKTWQNVAPAGMSTICPFRRGMCVGRIGGKYVMAIGNLKFFYSTTDYLCKSEVVLDDFGEVNDGDAGHKVGKVLLTEKANGEFTMCTAVRDDQTNYWLVVGSKNVRLAIPYTGKPGEMLKAMEEITSASSDDEVRFSYLKEMLGIWSDKLEASENHPTSNPVLWSILETATVIGEQVGVHKHIFDDYPFPDVRVFAVLNKSDLLLHAGCDVSHLSSMLEGSGLSSVGCESFPLHGTIGREDHLVTSDDKLLGERVTNLRARLDEIAAGPINVYGEGVVVCTYDKYGDLLEMFKFKNQEYAFDRKLRTQVSNVAVRFPGVKLGSSKSKSTITDMLTLRNTASSIRRSLQSSLNTEQFDLMSKDFGEDRLELVPYLLLILYQQPYLCSNFSDLFTKLMALARDMRDGVRLGEQSGLVSWFSNRMLYMSKLHDPIEAVAEGFGAEVKATLDLNRSLVRPVEELAQEVADYVVKTNFKMVGFSAPPGAGKSTLLQVVSRILAHKHKVKSGVFDRDQYTMRVGNPKDVSALWFADIRACIRRGEVALVGNCLDGDFADGVEVEVGSKMLVVVPSEVPFRTKKQTRKKRRNNTNASQAVADPGSPQVALFMCYCIERLMERDMMLEPSVVELEKDSSLLDGVVEDEDELLIKSKNVTWKLNETGSTLTMELGASIVLNKFFMTAPLAAMMERRAKNGSVFRMSMFKDYKSLTIPVNLKEKLVQLKQSVLEPAPAQGAHTSSGLGNAHVRRAASSLVPLEMVKDNIDELLNAAEVLYSSVTPTEASHVQLQSLASRSTSFKFQDGHMTVQYRPTLEDTRRLTETLKGENCFRVSLPIAARVRVELVEPGAKQNDALELVVPDYRHEDTKRWIALFGNRFLHVTLGTTNPQKLPPGISRMVVEKLVEVFGEKAFVDRSNCSLELRKQSTSSVMASVSVSVFSVKSFSKTAVVFEGHVSLVHKAISKQSERKDKLDQREVPVPESDGTKPKEQHVANTNDPAVANAKQVTVNPAESTNVNSTCDEENSNDENSTVKKRKSRKSRKKKRQNKQAEDKQSSSTAHPQSR